MTLKHAWEVLLLFVIPIGGGIPGGVVLAKSYGIAWPWMELLYCISDIILAFVFEPIMLGVIAMGKRSPKVGRAKEAFKTAMMKTVPNYGQHLGPISLIAITFGTDPMTGRAVSAAAGHGFVSGWILTIIGDMLYFTLIMACTLWLSHILGDGTLATLIILVVMMFGPTVIRRIKESWLK